MAKTPEQKEIERQMREQQRQQVEGAIPPPQPIPDPIDRPGNQPETIDAAVVTAEQNRPLQAAHAVAEPTTTAAPTATPVATQAPAPAAATPTATPTTTTPAPATPAETPAPAGAQTASIGQQLLEKDRAASLNPANGLEKPADLENSNVDPYVAAVAKASRDEQRTFAEWALAQKKDDEKAIKDSEEKVNADLRASKWTGLTELAASIANLIGVGEGNAVSQQYKSHSQDWMQKADQDMREHRSRIDNLRQRQRDTELKMQQLKTEGKLALSKAKMEAEQQKWATAYNKARIEYENARTDAAKQKAAQDAKKAEAEYNAIMALANQREASARGNLIRAGATQQNANSRASSVENQNSNRDARTASQNMVDLSRAGFNWSRASGQPVAPPPGWSVQAPQTQGQSNLPPRPSSGNVAPTDERNLPVAPSRRR